MTDLEFMQNRFLNMEIANIKLSQGTYMMLTPAMIETKLEVNPPRCAKCECENLVFDTMYCDKCHSEFLLNNKS